MVVKFKGERFLGKTEVLAVGKDGVPRRLKPRRPGRFEWSDFPSQELCFAILKELVGPVDAEKYCDELKRRFPAKLGDRWELPAGQVLCWLEEKAG